MENSFQTSFIPKKPIDTNNKDVVSHSPLNFLTVAALMILIITIFVTGGFFFYKKYLTTQKEDVAQQLKDARKKFEIDTIKDLETFDTRVAASEKILNSHLVMSPLFSLLGSITIPSIQYTKFNQSSSASNVFEVKMSGIATDYKSIAIQSDVFNTEKGSYFKNVVFSNLTKDKDGHVNFDVSFVVDPDLLSYVKNSEKEKNTNKNMIQSQTQVVPQAVIPNNKPLQ